MNRNNKFYRRIIGHLQTKKKKRFNRTCMQIAHCLLQKKKRSMLMSSSFYNNQCVSQPMSNFNSCNGKVLSWMNVVIMMVATVQQMVFVGLIAKYFHFAKQIINPIYLMKEAQTMEWCFIDFLQFYLCSVQIHRSKSKTTTTRKMAYLNIKIIVRVPSVFTSHLNSNFPF